jgi:hypothetical protein
LSQLEREQGARIVLSYVKAREMTPKRWLQELGIPALGRIAAPFGSA